jgi:hypothetical protein
MSRIRARYDYPSNARDALNCFLESLVSRPIIRNTIKPSHLNERLARIEKRTLSESWSE